MPRERDLFRAIVIAGLAVVGGCDDDPKAIDDGAIADASIDSTVDAGDSADDPSEDAGDDSMVLIL